MNKSAIDNPDLHLKIDVNQKVIKAVLEENLDVEIIVITDLIDFDFYEKNLIIGFIYINAMTTLIQLP
ncbi:MAG: hypothetical protein R3E90_06825 [Marinicella sp.]